MIRQMTTPTARTWRSEREEGRAGEPNWPQRELSDQGEEDSLSDTPPVLETSSAARNQPRPALRSRKRWKRNELLRQKSGGDKVNPVWEPTSGDPGIHSTATTIATVDMEQQPSSGDDEVESVHTKNPLSSHPEAAPSPPAREPNTYVEGPRPATTAAPSPPAREPNTYVEGPRLATPQLTVPQTNSFQPQIALLQDPP